MLLPLLTMQPTGSSVSLVVRPKLLNYNALLKDVEGLNNAK